MQAKNNYYLGYEKYVAERSKVYGELCNANKTTFFLMEKCVGGIKHVTVSCTINRQEEYSSELLLLPAVVTERFICKSTIT